MNTLVPVRVKKNGEPFKMYIPDPDKFSRAFTMFITGKPVLEITKELDVPHAILKSWIKRNRWVVQRNALINESVANVQEQLKVIISANILQVAERNLDTAEQIDDHIQIHLAKPTLGTKAIADLSRAAVSSAKIASAVVGLERATEEAAKPVGPIQWNIQLLVDDQAPKAITADTTLMIAETGT